MSGEVLLGRIREQAARTVRFRFALDEHALARRVAAVLETYCPPPADGVRLLGTLALDDLYLATACGDGDEAAWSEMESAHFGFIRDFALRCTRRDPPAGDVAEAVIAELWERGKIRQFAGRSSLRTWLGTVVAHTAINAVKRSEKTLSLSDPDRSSQPSADDASARDLADAAARAIAGLEAADRLLLLLYYDQEMTLEQMERALGKSKAALSRRLDKVRRELRARIEADVGPARAEEIDLARVTLDLARVLSARNEAPESVSHP